MSEHLSQELSARLHELGVVVEFKSVYSRKSGRLYPLHLFEHELEMSEFLAAPTFTELWAVILETFNYNGEQTSLDMWKSDGTEGLIEGEFCTKYRVWDRPILDSFRHHESPTEAIALLLIWLKENNHV